MLHNDLASLHPKAQPIFRTFRQKLIDAKIPFAMLETLREQEVQIAYYAQGRKPLDEVNKIRSAAGLWAISEAENRNVITKCDGVNTLSNHQSGLAADIVPLDAKGRPWWNAPPEVWLKIAAIGEPLGLDWGGRWGSKSASQLGWDCPHWEYKGDL